MVKCAVLFRVGPGQLVVRERRRDPGELPRPFVEHVVDEPAHLGVSRVERLVLVHGGSGQKMLGCFNGRLHLGVVDACALELLLDDVPVHQLEHVRRAAPVLQHVLLAQSRRNSRDRAEVVQVSSRKPQSRHLSLGEHAVSVGRGCQTLGTHHDASQLCLDDVARCLRRRSVARHQSAPQVAEVLLERFSTLRSGQELDGLQEALVVVLAFGFVRQRVHLERRGRQEKEASVAVVEESPRQLGARVVLVQQGREPLELVQDDDVGLQGCDRSLRELLAHLVP